MPNIIKNNQNKFIYFPNTIEIHKNGKILLNLAKKVGGYVAKYGRTDPTKDAEKSVSEETGNFFLRDDFRVHRFQVVRAF